jgi:transcriptional regulator with XRE-family HTH domain
MRTKGGQQSSCCENERFSCDRPTTVRTVADNVFDAREAVRVTRKVMARLLGITATTLWRKETGGTEFKATELVAIAKVCGVDVGELLAVEEQEPKAVNDRQGG